MVDIKKEIRYGQQQVLVGRNGFGLVYLYLDKVQQALSITDVLNLKSFLEILQDEKGKRIVLHANRVPFYG